MDGMQVSTVLSSMCTNGIIAFWVIPDEDYLSAVKESQYCSVTKKSLLKPSFWSIYLLQG